MSFTRVVRPILPGKCRCSKCHGTGVYSWRVKGSDIETAGQCNLCYGTGSITSAQHQQRAQRDWERRVAYAKKMNPQPVQEQLDLGSEEVPS